jgi:hypothetical protein
MTHRDPKHMPIIHWPCGSRCHWRTVRAAYYRAHVFLQTLLIALVIAPGFLIALLNYRKGNLDERWFRILAIAAASLFVMSFATQVLPIWRTTVLGVLHTRRWRRQWRLAEQRSRFARQQVLDPKIRLTCDRVYELAADLPSLGWCLDDETDVNFDTLMVSDPLMTGALYEEFRRRILGEAARQLLQCSERVVLGRSLFQDVPSIIAVFAIGSNVQFWVIFQPRRTGNVLGFRVVTGHQWWGWPSYTAHGRYYFGDVFRAKMRERSLLCGWYAHMIVIFPVGVLTLLFRCMRQLIRPDVRRQTLFFADPRTGDSLDVRLIGSRRGTLKGGFGVHLLGDSMAQISALKQQVMRRMQRLPDAIQGQA